MLGAVKHAGSPLVTVNIAANAMMGPTMLPWMGSVRMLGKRQLVRFVRNIAPENAHNVEAPPLNTRTVATNPTTESRGRAFALWLVAEYAPRLLLDTLSPRKW